MRAMLLAMGVAGLMLAGCAGQERDTADDVTSYGASGAFVGQAPGADAGVAPIAAGDLDFLTQATYGGLAQVDYAGLAEQLAVDPAVREHERLMTADYGPANDELAALARTLGLTAPTTPDAGRVQTAHALQTLAGAAERDLEGDPGEEQVDDAVADEAGPGHVLERLAVGRA